MDDKAIEALTRLLEALIAWLGPSGTIYLLVGIVFALAIRRLYLDRRADKDRREALDEKERTIQRLANEARSWRILFAMKDQGMSRKDAEQLFLENDFASPLESRRALESKKERKRGK